MKMRTTDGEGGKKKVFGQCIYSKLVVIYIYTLLTIAGACW